MVYLGVSLVLASIAFAAYKNLPRSWRHYLSFKRLDQEQVAVPTGEGEKPNGDVRTHRERPEHSANERKESVSTDAVPSLPDSRSAPSEPAQTGNAATARPKTPPSLHIPDDGASSTSSSPTTPTAPKAVSAPSPPPTLAPPPSPRPAALKRPAPSSNTLMPPPNVIPSAIRPLPRLSQPARPPPSAAAGLRALPTSNRPPSAAQTLSTSTLPTAARPSRAVALAPGRSPLDWAALIRRPPATTFLRGADVPPHRLLKVSPAMVRRRNGRKGADAWATWQGRVYNVAPYLEYHPGGAKELMKGVGRVGTAERLFNETHPWVNWEGMLGECMVGILVGEGEGDEDGGAGADEKRMEEMD